MKKLLLVVFVCLFLCGCGKDFQASDFKWVKDRDFSYAVGTIKNNSSTKCSDLEVKLVYKNGDIKEDDFCFPLNSSEEDVINPGESKYVECMYTGDIRNITDYDINFVSAECYK